MTTEPLPHLDTFTEAAERTSFTAAARALGLTQAAVSQRIHALERELGVPLFRRTGGKVELTDAGRRLHDYARRILDLHREARREVTGRETPVEGELAIAASSIPGQHLLPALLAAFGAKHPLVRVKAAVSDSAAVIGQVERGEVSIGLVGRRNDDPHLEFRHLADDRMVVVTPLGHALNNNTRVTLDQPPVCLAPVAVQDEFGGAFRLMQGGNIRSSAVYVLLGVVLFLGVMASSGGAR